MSDLINPTKITTSSRKLWSFHGGVHPPFHKDDSNTLAIKSAGIPDKLVLPLRQHIGIDAEPCVSVGDKVFKGQLIAKHNHHVDQQDFSANIHAPTSGKITAIEEHSIPHPSGLLANCIILKTDGEDEQSESHKLAPFLDYKNTKAEEIIERIEQAGIVGLGGAVFPTAVKLAGSRKTQIKTLIINGAECEPYITCDDLLMREKSAEIITGIEILLHLLNAKECLIGIEDNKPEAIEMVRSACKHNHHIEVVSIPAIYPSGGEKQLIQILTGKEIPAGGLPLDLGFLGQNIGTVYSIYQAVIEGAPLISRIITVTGNGILHPQNYEVLIGTSFAYLATQAGGTTKMADHLIMGGPMMGFTLDDDDIPVVKASNCALFTSSTALRESNSAFSTQSTMPCIRCGKCMDVCPAKLLPQQLYWHIRAKDLEKVQEHNLKDCIECGCCNYVCPSHIPLVDYYRFAKVEIRDQKIAQEKADLSRERHEFLLFRKERDKRERDEKRAAHKAALQKKKADIAKKKSESGEDDSSDNTKADAIKQAMERAKAKKQARDESANKSYKKEDDAS
ncbi:MAG: electron transport complex subunit RsxC [Cocleimonas sp.]